MKRACVIGWPIEHSRSPMIHGYWLKKYGIDGSYAKEAVAPEALEEFLASLARNGYSGCNVTVPHKEKAFLFAKEKDASAIAVRAANTLWLANGELHAANTDTYGYMTYLERSVPDWSRKDAPVSILGAGGAARAIVHGFLSAGVGEVRVFNRTRDRAERLAASFGPRVRVFGWEERNEGARRSAVLVNTTIAGMKGLDDIEIDLARFDEDCIVSDIVYVPLETGLLRRARERGLRTVDGLGMLLHQAVPGFAKWFGVTPDVDRHLYDLIASDIGGG